MEWMMNGGEDGYTVGMPSVKRTVEDNEIGEREIHRGGE